MAEREAARRVEERLRVGELERGELRRPAEVDEGRGRLDRPDIGRRGIVAERPDVAMAVEPAVGGQPGRTPAEARHPVALEPLGERPQLIEPERLGGTGDVVLAHRPR